MQLHHGCSFQHSPGMPISILRTVLQLWGPNLYPSLCRGCFPPAHPGPPEPPCLWALHSLQVSRTLISPCVGHSNQCCSPGSSVGRRAGPAPSWLRKGCQLSLLSLLLVHQHIVKTVLASAQSVIPSLGQLCQRDSCHRRGAVHDSRADREQRWLRGWVCIQPMPVKQPRP